MDRRSYSDGRSFLAFFSSFFSFSRSLSSLGIRLSRIRAAAIRRALASKAMVIAN